MALITKNHTFSTGATILASEHNDNFNTIYNDYNGNITNTNIASNAAIVDTKLDQITTASKVTGDALTDLANIPSGAGDIPSENLDGNAVVLTGNQTITGVKTFSSIPVLPGSNPSSDNEASRKAYVDTSFISNIEDYGTSSSSSTSKNQSDLKICYGTVTVSGSSNQSVTNLPFTSSSSYIVHATYDTILDKGDDATATRNSGSQLTIHNGVSVQEDIMWLAIGT